jgi:hypothetical protein
MGNELLDYVERENFDFFKFSVLLKDEQKKEKLKADCEGVLEYAHATVQDMCLLGLKLKNLKESKTWEEVFHPNGYCFYNYSFPEFCEYAFGFSKTRTSNLLRIAEFVTLSSDNKGGWIDSRYDKYNTSQLVELAPVPEEHRKYFSPEMSVADMRLAKDYMKWGYFFADKLAPGFDLMKKANEYKAKKETEKQGNTYTSTQLPGQMSLEEMEEIEEVEEEEPLPNDVFYEEEKSDVGFCEDAPEEEYEEPEESEKYKRYEEVEVVVQRIYNLRSRDGAREFLADYKNWRRTLGCIVIFGSDVYTYTFENGVKISAYERQVFVGSEFDTTEKKVMYFLNQHDGQDEVEISQNQFEKYCALMKGEL